MASADPEEIQDQRGGADDQAEGRRIEDGLHRQTVQQERARQDEREGREEQQHAEAAFQVTQEQFHLLTPPGILRRAW